MGDPLISVVISFLSVCVACFSACLAYRSNKISASVLEKDDSRSLLEQAQLSLERAYDTLTNDGINTSPPLPDRLNWLTTARYIERYKDLKSKITDKTHLLICDQQEEYFRHRFYLVLRDQRLIQEIYYSAKGKSNPNGPIEPRSAVVIHAFSMWQEQQIDPIKDVNIGEYILDGKIFNGKPGLMLYIQNNMKNSAK